MFFPIFIFTFCLIAGAKYSPFFSVIHFAEIFQTRQSSFSSFSLSKKSAMWYFALFLFSGK